MLAHLWTVLALVTASGWALAVCVVDIRTLRIPAAVAAAGIVPVAAAGVAGAEWSDMAAGAVASALLYLVLRLISPSGLGGGDLRLAPACGALSATGGAWPWAAALVGGFLFTAALAVPVLLAHRWRGGRGTPIGVPHGPGMALSAVAVAWCVLLGGW